MAAATLFLARPLFCEAPSPAPDDAAMKAQLLVIFDNDQKYRLQLGDVEKAHGMDSPEVRALWGVIQEHDRDDLAKVEAILGRQGWVGPDRIGTQANTTIFLVIQHADHATQEKYLPMMREAVKAGNAGASALALLEDRVALGEHRLQIYGSQIGRDSLGAYYVRPLEDPDHVDQRRARVGLGPLAEYVKQWGIPWDPAAYKKALPDLEIQPFPAPH